jgi:hypothetical protein
VRADAPHQIPVMRVSNGVCGINEPRPTANGDAEPVGIGADPVSAVAIWMPGLNDHPCRARRTVIGRAAARRLAADVLRSPTASGISNCPFDDARTVQIWFQFDDQRDQTVMVGLRGCTSVWAAGRRPRRAAVELLRDLADVAPQPWREGLRACVRAEPSAEKRVLGGVA